MFVFGKAQWIPFKVIEIMFFVFIFLTMARKSDKNIALYFAYDPDSI